MGPWSNSTRLYANYDGGAIHSTAHARMTNTARYSWLALAALVLPLTGTAFAQADPKPAVVSPFDKDDPEIHKLRALNWKAVDFDGQDLETRTTALLAMQQVLSMTGGKASARLELLIDYIDQNK